MSNMQETLSVLVNGPIIKENDFDDIQSSFGNERLFSFDVHDYVHFYCDGGENKIVIDKTDLNDNYMDVLLTHLYGYSTDTDSNEASRQLVDEYRNFVLESLKG